MKFANVFAVTALAALLSACASTGDVTGAPVEDRGAATATTEGGAGQAPHVLQGMQVAAVGIVQAGDVTLARHEAARRGLIQQRHALLQLGLHPRQVVILNGVALGHPLVTAITGVVQRVRCELVTRRQQSTPASGVRLQIGRGARHEKRGAQSSRRELLRGGATLTGHGIVVGQRDGGASARGPERLGRGMNSRMKGGRGHFSRRLSPNTSAGW